MKKGDVFMAVLDPVVGSEQGGRRPVVIMQNNAGNRHSTTVIAVPVTASAKPALPTHAAIPRGEGGLWLPSIALCEQVRTLEKSRLKYFIGALNPQRLRELERALLISLDIACPAGDTN